MEELRFFFAGITLTVGAGAFAYLIISGYFLDRGNFTRREIRRVAKMIRRVK